MSSNQQQPPPPRRVTNVGSLLLTPQENESLFGCLGKKCVVSGGRAGAGPGGLSGSREGLGRVGRKMGQQRVRPREEGVCLRSSEAPVGSPLCCRPVCPTNGGWKAWAQVSSPEVYCLGVKQDKHLMASNGVKPFFAFCASISPPCPLLPIGNLKLLQAHCRK
uniref:Uncharacterized protein n=1 Tax=Sphaerodactylus townsendi TaxID=933632 RepID=A0ACB8FQT5_9SAUR